MTVGNLGDNVRVASSCSLVSTAPSSLFEWSVPFSRMALPFRVRWPLDRPVTSAASLALFSLNCLYVVVLGITSDKNSRLSMRETAVAKQGEAYVSHEKEEANGSPFCSHLSLCIVYSSWVSSLI